MSDSFETPGTGTRQAPLSMGFPRQDYRSGLHFLLQGIFLTERLNPSVCISRTAGRFFCHGGSPLYGYRLLFFTPFSRLAVAQMVSSLSAMWETRVWSLGWEDALEKAMAPHSIVLAWKIPWMEEPGRLQSMGSQRIRHDWETSLPLSCLWTCELFPTEVSLSSSLLGRYSRVALPDPAARVCVTALETDRFSTVIIPFCFKSSRLHFLCCKLGITGIPLSWRCCDGEVRYL